ncbi:hypothetical protein BDY21DRAFT_372664 [Lineolata rhizophorae]|uniref:Uncharacterized protein n=1 Tax=Lineolata rhizophorae TaxID=578093 RepID=A0A6A6NXX6_9PEZI|nr:hypothetical protein BDY21DRAFT_372664 [Lineolata rhizophorae]
MAGDDLARKFENNSLYLLLTSQCAHGTRPYHRALFLPTRAPYGHLWHAVKPAGRWRLEKKDRLEFPESRALILAHKVAHIPRHLISLCIWILDRGGPLPPAVMAGADQCEYHGQYRYQGQQYYQQQYQQPYQYRYQEPPPRELRRSRRHSDRHESHHHHQRHHSHREKDRDRDRYSTREHHGHRERHSSRHHSSSSYSAYTSSYPSTYPAVYTHPSYPPTTPSYPPPEPFGCDVWVSSALLALHCAGVLVLRQNLDQMNDELVAKARPYLRRVERHMGILGMAHGSGSSERSRVAVAGMFLLRGDSGRGRRSGR